MLCYIFVIFDIYLSLYIPKYWKWKLWSGVCSCVFICVCGHLWSSGPMEQSLRALSRTWGLGPPTTRSPPIPWWTPWGATQVPVTEDPLCLRWGQKLKVFPRNMLKSWPYRIRPESHPTLLSNRKRDTFSCQIMTVITCWWRRQQHTLQ